MVIQLRPLAFCLTLCTAALLSACGGGSDADGTVDPGGNNNGGGGSTPAVVDRFVGSFASPCMVNEDVLQVSSGQPVRLVRTMVVSKISDTQARYVQRDTYHAPGDTECKGGSIGSVSWDKPGNTLTFGSSVSQTVGNQTVAAYRVEGELEAIGGISSGTTVTVNDLRFPGTFFIEAYSFLDLLALSADGSKLYAGDIDTEDANGYPTALDTTFYLTRLP